MCHSQNQREFQSDRDSRNSGGCRYEETAALIQSAVDGYNVRPDKHFHPPHSFSSY